MFGCVYITAVSLIADNNYITNGNVDVKVVIANTSQRANGSAHNVMVTPGRIKTL